MRRLDTSRHWLSNRHRLEQHSLSRPRPVRPQCPDMTSSIQVNRLSSDAVDNGLPFDGTGAASLGLR